MVRRDPNAAPLVIAMLDKPPRAPQTEDELAAESVLRDLAAGDAKGGGGGGGSGPELTVAMVDGDEDADKDQPMLIRNMIPGLKRVPWRPPINPRSRPPLEPSRDRRIWRLRAAPPTRASTSCLHGFLPARRRLACV